jgi:hypothetical protein
MFKKSEIFLLLKLVLTSRGVMIEKLQFLEKQLMGKN